MTAVFKPGAGHWMVLEKQEILEEGLKRGYGLLEMWSVVVFPLALMRMGISVASLPSHSLKGSRICSLLLEGETATLTDIRSCGGAW